MRFPSAAQLLLATVLAGACAGDDAREATDSLSTDPVETGSDTGWVARPDRVGGIRTGMRRSELLGVIGQPSRAGYYTHDRCSYVRGTALPAGVQIMIFDSTVARVDVREPGVATREGMQVGDPESEVLAAYEGRVTVTPHAYSGPQWHYLTVTMPGDPAHRIVFETDGSVVQNYRVGRIPEVEWVEGCS